MNATASGRPLNITALTGLAQCAPLRLEWVGGAPPYEVQAMYPVRVLARTNATRLDWLCDYPAGRSVSFAVRDAAGGVSYTRASLADIALPQVVAPGRANCTLSRETGYTRTLSGTSFATATRRLPSASAGHRGPHVAPVASGIIAGGVVVVLLIIVSWYCIHRRLVRRGPREPAPPYTAQNEEGARAATPPIVAYARDRSAVTHPEGAPPVYSAEPAPPYSRFTAGAGADTSEAQSLLSTRPMTSPDLGTRGLSSTDSVTPPPASSDGTHRPLSLEGGGTAGAREERDLPSVPILTYEAATSSTAGPEGRRHSSPEHDGLGK